MAADEPNLILAGFMGTGKSTVGRIVADVLGRLFVDTDRLIEQDAGLSVSEIFARHGEPAFRALEREACLRVARVASHVAAIGGGALLDPSSKNALEATGVVVLLTCHPDVLIERLRGSAGRGERPLLASDFEANVARLLTEREPVYASVSLRIDTTGREPDETAEQVLAVYEAEVRQMTKAGNA